MLSIIPDTWSGLYAQQYNIINKLVVAGLLTPATSYDIPGTRYVHVLSFFVF